MNKPISDGKEILELMRNGWELGLSDASRTNPRLFWLQKNGLCRGGEVKKVHASTAQSLIRKDLIIGQKRERFWLMEFKLKL